MPSDGYDQYEQGRQDWQDQPAPWTGPPVPLSPRDSQGVPEVLRTQGLLLSSGVVPLSDRDQAA